MTPEDIGPYLIERAIGRGGQATVYLGRDQAGEAVAIKVFDPRWLADPESREQLTAEIEALKGVAGFGIARLIDAQPDADPAYLVSEYVSGPDLAHAVGSRGPLRGGELERFALATLTALRSVHHAGLVHRDIKPSNVVLGPDGPRLVDFGIVAHRGEVEDTSDGVLGTREYLAPELTSVAAQPVSTASDIYSWAATVAFAASGEVPTGADAALPGVPRALAEVLRRCLDPDPASRPDAAAAMELVLQAAHDSRGDAVRVERARPVTPQPSPPVTPQPSPPVTPVPSPRPAVPAWGTPPPDATPAARTSPSRSTPAPPRPASTPPPRPVQPLIVGRRRWTRWRWPLIPLVWVAFVISGFGDHTTENGQYESPAGAQQVDVDDPAANAGKTAPVQLFAVGIRAGFAVSPDGSTVTAQEGCSLLTKATQTGRTLVTRVIDSAEATCRLVPDPTLQRVLGLTEVSRTRTRLSIDGLGSVERVIAVIPGTVQRVQFSADGRSVAIGVDGNRVQRLDTRTGRLLGAGMRTATGGAWGIWAADADLDAIAAARPEDAGVAVWSPSDDPNGERLAALGDDAASQTFPLAVDVSSGRVARLARDGSGTVTLSSPEDGASATRLPWLLGSGTQEVPVALAFSRDGTYLAGFGRDGGQIWRVEDGALVGPQLGTVAGVIDPSSANALDSSAELRFSEDASHLVLRTGRGVVLAWEVRDATSSS